MNRDYRATYAAMLLASGLIVTSMAAPIDLGDRRELMIDACLIGELDRVRLRFMLKDADLYARRFVP